MRRFATVTRTAVIRCKVPRWISQRAFVHEINNVLSSAASGEWIRVKPDGTGFETRTIERFRAGHPKRDA